MLEFIRDSSRALSMTFPGTFLSRRYKKQQSISFMELSSLLRVLLKSCNSDFRVLIVLLRVPMSLRVVERKAKLSTGGGTVISVPWVGEVAWPLWVRVVSVARSPWIEVVSVGRKNTAAKSLDLKLSEDVWSLLTSIENKLPLPRI